GAGNVSGPYNVDTRPYKYQWNAAVGYDGRNYLIVWDESDIVYNYPRRLYTDTVMALRVSESGQALDSAPIVVRYHATTNDRAYFYAIPRGVSFDGNTYSVFWRESRHGPDKLFVQQVGIDGTLRGKRTGISMASRYNWMVTMSPHCLGSNCLLLWGNRTGASNAAGYYMDDVYAVRYQSGRVLDSSPTLVLSNINVGLGYPHVCPAGDHFSFFA